MTLTDYQKSILLQSAEVFYELGIEDIFHDYNDYFDGITLADHIREFVKESDYLYDQPAGPMTKAESEFKPPTRAQFEEALKDSLTKLIRPQVEAYFKL